MLRGYDDLRKREMAPNHFQKKIGCQFQCRIEKKCSFFRRLNDYGSTTIASIHLLITSTGGCPGTEVTLTFID